MDFHANTLIDPLMPGVLNELTIMVISSFMIWSFYGKYSKVKC